MKKLFLALLCLCLVLPVMAAHDYYPDRNDKVVPFNLVKEYNNMTEATYGTLVGRLRCGDNIMTPVIGIRTLDNKEFRMFKIRPDGVYEEPLNPGRYEACLFNSRGEQDGNGGQPECSYFNIVARKPSYTERELMGHAYSGEPKKEITPEPTCHTHKIWIFEWGWVRHCGRFFCWWQIEITGGHWYEWECCKQHCDSTPTIQSPTPDQ